jgi:hypothetical protein
VLSRKIHDRANPARNMAMVVASQEATGFVRSLDFKSHEAALNSSPEGKAVFKLYLAFYMRDSEADAKRDMPRCIRNKSSSRVSHKDISLATRAEVAKAWADVLHVTADGVCERAFVITGNVMVNGVQRSCTSTEKRVKSGFRIRGGGTYFGDGVRVANYGRIVEFLWAELVCDENHNARFRDALKGKGRLFATVKLYASAPDIGGDPVVYRHDVVDTFIIPASVVGDMVVLVDHPLAYEPDELLLVSVTAEERRVMHNTLCILECSQKKWLAPD